MLANKQNSKARFSDERQSLLYILHSECIRLYFCTAPLSLTRKINYNKLFTHSPYACVQMKKKHHNSAYIMCFSIVL